MTKLPWFKREQDFTDYVALVEKKNSILKSKETKSLQFWANTGLMCEHLLPPAWLFWLKQCLLSSIHQQGQKRPAMFLLFIPESHLKALFEETLLHQGLQINSEKAAFAYILSIHGALQQHSFCSALLWWLTSCCGRWLRLQHASCALIVWPCIRVFHI